jgi:hypothetical protein
MDSTGLQPIDIDFTTVESDSDLLDISFFDIFPELF